MKTFQIPDSYKSTIIAKLKTLRRVQDPRKKDITPTYLDFGPVGFYIARHFGFCYGVENAIEISFKAVAENKGKRIFLLSQMIHNPEVNQDLAEKGVQFLQDTNGKQLLSLDELKKDDIVIIPAFGATLQNEAELERRGIEIQKYNTTCPFVERVWKKSEQIGKEEYTIIIHGKHTHEETRATFSRSEKNAPTVVVKDLAEAKKLGAYILGTKETALFYEDFKDKHSLNFDVNIHLQKVGVINQTTMLATETQEIADYFKQLMLSKYANEPLKNHFSDTRDTLCYATNENQDATQGLLQTRADFAVVVGGYNSSNTSHLVELLEQKFPTYFISSEQEIESNTCIHHFDYTHQKKISTSYFIPKKNKVNIVLTSGASCPDTTVERVLLRLLCFFENTRNPEEVVASILKS
ncbi:MAG: 4-hydroxy-3-methylbut-2-enyl diphosphate reductase [Bacteroidetes bacterium]|nr:4-hydroxy-3-methylbut-2-enyl diphosphate reductase [Bacteroidota bacterium]